MKSISKVLFSLVLTVVFAACGTEETEETTVAETTQTTTGSGTALNGEALYATNCQGCHGDLNNSAKTGSSAAAIKNAIANEASMANISLTDAEIAAISTALN